MQNTNAQIANALLTADGRPAAIAIAEETNARSLLDILKADQTLSGRVVESFPGDKYLVNIRSRNMIASSATPLAKDSIIQFKVLETAGGLKIQLLAPDAEANNVKNSNQNSLFSLERSLTAKALNLPNTEATKIVLNAYESAKIPISVESVQKTINAVKNLPVQTAVPLADAHALLAKANLPATPVLLSMAESALSNTMPKLATDSNTIINLLAPRSNEGMTTSTNQNAATLSASGNNTTAPVVASTNNQAILQTGLPIVVNAETGLPITNNATNAVATENAATVNTIFPNLTPAQEDKINLFLNKIIHNNINISESPEKIANSLMKQMQNLATSNNNPAQNIQELEQQVALRERVQIEGTTISRPEIEERLTNAITRVIGGENQSPEMQSAVSNIAKEWATNLIFKPQTFNDYSIVVPIAVSFDDKPVPAKFAVSTQTSQNGETSTFLRVDLELDKLGEVSIRLNNASEGVLAVSIFTSNSNSDEVISEGIDDLVNDLEKLGITANIRTKLEEE